MWEGAYRPKAKYTFTGVMSLDFQILGWVGDKLKNPRSAELHRRHSVCCPRQGQNDSLSHPGIGVNISLRSCVNSRYALLASAPGWAMVRLRQLPFSLRAQDQELALCKGNTPPFALHGLGFIIVFIIFFIIILSSFLSSFF